MEDRMQNYISMEIMEPKRRIVRSDGAFFLLLLAIVFAVIFLGNFLQNQFGIPRAYIQISLYLILCLLAVWIYTKRLVYFRYLLTDRMFSASRLVGKKERPGEQIHLSGIFRICFYPELQENEKKKLYRYYHGRKENSVALVFKEGSRCGTLLLSPTNGMRESIIEQWKKTRR